MSENLTFIQSKKGSNHLVLGNYEHRKYRTVGNTSYWRCVNVNCSGRLILTAGMITKKVEHNHEPDTMKLIQATQRNNAKRIATIENFCRVKDTYNRATMETISASDQPRDEVVASLKTYDQLRGTINRARAKRFPTLPKSIEEIDVPSALSSSANGLFFRLNVNRMLIFVTNEFLHYFCSADHIYADGTFRSVPRLFQSLYSLHIMKNGIMVPIIYALLPDSTLSTYLQLFRSIQDLCIEMNLIWNPKKFTTDFEAAVIKAIQITFPNCEMKCCLFHYSQSLWRNVGKHGLIERYKSDSDGVKNTIKRLSALPFIKVEDIPNCYQMIINEAPSDDNMISFLEYFSRTYLNEESRFPLTIWNHFRDNDPRTNNHVEGWHSGFNRAVGRNHANLWIFIENLVKQQNAYEINILMADYGARSTTGSRIYGEINKRIMCLTADYDNNLITAFECLDKLKFYTKLSDLS